MIVCVCVGGLEDLGRTTVPLTGAQVFGLTTDLAVFASIIAFGVAIAFTNLVPETTTPPSTEKTTP